jgi:hypothetical protein
MQAIEQQHDEVEIKQIERPDYTEPTVPPALDNPVKKPFVKPPLLRVNGKRNLFDKM